MTARRLWTPEEDARVAEMVASDHNIGEIMAALGRTRAAVAKRVNESGLRISKAGRFRAQSEHMKLRAADPVYRERQRAGCVRGWAGATARRQAARDKAIDRDLMGHCHRAVAADPAKAAAKIDGNRRTLLARAAKAMAWCPEPYRDAYRHLVYVKQFKAAEARRIVEVDIALDAARREAATERESERLAAAERAHRRSFAGMLEQAARGKLKVVDLDVVQPRQVPLRERDGAGA